MYIHSSQTFFQIAYVAAIWSPCPSVSLNQGRLGPRLQFWLIITAILPEPTAEERSHHVND